MEEEAIFICLTISTLAAVLLTNRLVSTVNRRPGVIKHVVPPISRFLPDVLNEDERRLFRKVLLSWGVLVALWLLAYFRGHVE